MLVPDNQLIELGTLRSGSTHNFTYTLTNTGDKHVMISKLRVGCGSCTEATMRSPFVRAGEKAVIDVKFSPTSIGKNVKYINVAYDDQLLRLEFQADVQP